AQDYLVKGQMDEVLLRRAVRYAMERKRVERALRDSEAFYQSLVESLPQYIYRKDAQGRFTFANRRFCVELGRTFQEIVGHTDYDFFPAELAEKYQADDQRVMTAGKVFEAVEEHTPPGGEKEYVQVVKSPVFDAQGKIIGTQGIFWDVTARVRGEEKLKKAHTDLARSREDLLRTLADLQRSHSRFKEAQQQMVEMEKMQTVGQMAAGIAHEVKNPLAVIRMGMDDQAGLCQRLDQRHPRHARRGTAHGAHLHQETHSGRGPAEPRSPPNPDVSRGRAGAGHGDRRHRHGHSAGQAGTGV
ncbi:MAG: PAS domain S-box protein, partial [Verrucomicrobia bacterium]|nr:PAS domain S-box protein [Verrucomicrobiota bacterium]